LPNIIKLPCVHFDLLHFTQQMEDIVVTILLPNCYTRKIVRPTKRCISHSQTVLSKMECVYFNDSIVYG